MNFDTFDASYLDRLRCGDKDTEQHFVRYFSELIQLKLRSRFASQQAAHDILQETFARVFALLRSEQGIRHAERLGALVNSVCNHVIYEQYRSDQRFSELEEETASMLMEQSPDALHQVLSQETREQVRHILNTLNERDHLLLKAVFLEEMDKDDICREFGVTRGYIRVLLHRAKQSFKKAYFYSKEN